MTKTVGCRECKGWIRLLQDKGLNAQPHPDLRCGTCKTNELEVYNALMAADKAQEDYEAHCEAMESLKDEDIVAYLHTKEHKD